MMVEGRRLFSEEDVEGGTSRAAGVCEGTKVGSCSWTWIVGAEGGRGGRSCGGVASFCWIMVGSQLFGNVPGCGVLLLPSGGAARNGIKEESLATTVLADCCGPPNKTGTDELHAGVCVGTGMTKLVVGVVPGGLVKTLVGGMNVF